ncbi:iron transporter [Conexibacter arvalis]|uniref:Uncharacterized protein involved in high-affinity Fe2+ transport n=1 Tax=Conexibacter arvalis TaxID=912552 RepID=A0A840IGV8_9ACTN|nr:iron transporter [Conexibacter arvalis]MBB4663471.1 uncharacterized protein involved in high-affinity Fe2+ transport [Conexibacter arvalis]
MTIPRTCAALCAAALLALGTSACGSSSDDDAAATAAATAPATTPAESGGHAGMDHGAGHGDPMQMDGEMRPLATKEQDGMKIEVVAMGPEPFTVEEGGRTIHHRPKPDDNAHLMVTLTDVETGDRIPYSSVQIALSRDGRRLLDTRLWPMIAQTVGMHYGENVALPESGRFDAVVTVGAPEVARHRELAGRWTRPVKLSFPLDWTAPR